MAASDSITIPSPIVTVIVPARNEEACLGRCLASLCSQDINLEILVVDDDSSDHTREIAEGYPGVKVLTAGPLRNGWTGKCNALCSAVSDARGVWLLFTDADTIHQPGSLASAIDEAKRYGAEMLSYSPAQELRTAVERAVMPVIFAELANFYPPEKVNDPAIPLAASNGQYILILRSVYLSVGGHAAVAKSLIEDVDLARLVKSSGYKIRFRYGGDAVSTRMYRSFAQLYEGWTKNLALLFSNPLRLAMIRFIELLGLATFPLLAVVAGLKGQFYNAGMCLLVAAFFAIFFVRRIRRAHPDFYSLLWSFPGLAVFVVLLVSSYIHTTLKRDVEWKGRHYRPGGDSHAFP